MVTHTSLQALGIQRPMESWGSLFSHPSLLSKIQARERPVSKTVTLVQGDQFWTSSFSGSQLQVWLKWGGNEMGEKQRFELRDHLFHVSLTPNLLSFHVSLCVCVLFLKCRLLLCFETKSVTGC